MDTFYQRILVLLSAVLVCYFVWLLGPILAPFIAAFILAYVLNPLVERIHRMGLRRWVAITLIFTAVTAVIALALWLLIPLIWEQVVYTKNRIPDVTRWINRDLRSWLVETTGIRMDRLDFDAMTTQVTEYLQSRFSSADAQQFISRLTTSGMSLLNVLGLGVLVPIVTFYFLMDWKEMLYRLKSLIPKRLLPRTMRIAHECDEVMGAFIRGQLLVMVLLGSVYAIGLHLVGISVGIIIGMVAGLASIIPYLGFAVGLVAAVIACLFQFGMDWTQLALVAVVFMIGQIIEGYVLQPLLLGDRIGLSPVAVIFAVLAGAQLMGFTGMLLALPVAALLVVFFRHGHQLYASSRFYLKPPTAQQSAAAVAGTSVTVLPEPMPDTQKAAIKAAVTVPADTVTVPDKPAAARMPPQDQ